MSILVDNIVNLWQIVELMGGAIGVDSREGLGSLFWFTARFRTVASALAPVPLRLKPTECGLTVAVAARNATLRGVLSRCLRAYGLPAAASVSAPSVIEVEAFFKDRGQPAVLVVCVEGPARQRGHDVRGGAGSKLSRPSEDGGAIWRAAAAEVATALERRPMMRGIVLCPPEGLGHLAQLKHHPRCTIVSRPARFAALHMALSRTLSMAEHGPAFNDIAQDKGCQGWSERAMDQDRQLHSQCAAVNTLAPTKTVGESCPRGSARRDEGKGGVVLVVDDDPAQRRVLKLMLEREGYVVRVFSWARKPIRFSWFLENR